MSELDPSLGRSFCDILLHPLLNMSNLKRVVYGQISEIPLTELIMNSEHIYVPERFYNNNNNCDSVGQTIETRKEIQNELTGKKNEPLEYFMYNTREQIRKKDLQKRILAC